MYETIYLHLFMAKGWLSCPYHARRTIVLEPGPVALLNFGLLVISLLYHKRQNVLAICLWRQFIWRTWRQQTSTISLPPYSPAPPTTCEMGSV